MVELIPHDAILGGDDPVAQSGLSSSAATTCSLDPAADTAQRTNQQSLDALDTDRVALCDLGKAQAIGSMRVEYLALECRQLLDSGLHVFDRW
jgi:hypothetical protein